jgi:ABC-type transport system substrate-binding protein
MTNRSGWRNPNVDALIPQLQDGYLALTQPEEYRQLWLEFQQIFAGELPALPLFNLQRPVVAASTLVGLAPSPFHLLDTWNIHAWELGD